MITLLLTLLLALLLTLLLALLARSSCSVFLLTLVVPAVKPHCRRRHRLSPTLRLRLRRRRRRLWAPFAKHAAEHAQ